MPKLLVYFFPPHPLSLWDSYQSSVYLKSVGIGIEQFNQGRGDVFMSDLGRLGELYQIAMILEISWCQKQYDPIP
ncbi:MAG: hypothetical protein F6J94_14615 [Moorea sp. SIO1F2]|uniref:hypothetical protein n=1 Tax=Moorena sp. SIO1F2 TaxID=2607819 RepID=UPI0013BC0ABF|nr:hypothetical protein [Moorena sp. SIO1F2]NET83109.1 hypothetical protein [Moorena sp. SIO1F2]